MPVELLDGALRVLAVHEVDKCEAARLARVAVVRNVDPRDRPKRTEQVLRRARTRASAQHTGHHAQQDAGSNIHADLCQQAVTHTTAKQVRALAVELAQKMKTRSAKTWGAQAGAEARPQAILAHAGLRWRGLARAPCSAARARGRGRARKSSSRVSSLRLVTRTLFSSRRRMLSPSPAPARRLGGT